MTSYKPKSTGISQENRMSIYDMVDDDKGLALTREDRSSGIILRLQGNLDLSTFTILKDALSKVNFAPGLTLVIDLSSVEYIDSTGIGVLMRTVTDSKKMKAYFYITGLQPEIEKVFKVTGLLNYFQVLNKDDFVNKYLK